MYITAITVKMWVLCVKVSLSTISVFMHTERGVAVRVNALACVAALLKSAPNIATYLARYLPHPVTASAEPLMSVYICMRSLRGKFCFSVYIV